MHLAGRTLQEQHENDEARLGRMFRLSLGREPRNAESQRLSKLLIALRSEGSEAEAWTAVARVLMNLDEFITRE